MEIQYKKRLQRKGLAVACVHPPPQLLSQMHLDDYLGVVFLSCLEKPSPRGGYTGDPRPAKAWCHSQLVIPRSRPTSKDAWVRKGQ